MVVLRNTCTTTLVNDHLSVMSSAAFSPTACSKSHMRSLTGELSFKCEECSVAFSESGNLKKLMHSHTEREECRAAFNQTTNPKKHVHPHW